jgi:hypothetical protein
MAVYSQEVVLGITERRNLFKTNHMVRLFCVQEIAGVSGKPEGRSQ